MYHSFTTLNMGTCRKSESSDKCYMFSFWSIQQLKCAEVLRVGFSILCFFLHCRLGIYSRGRIFNFAHVQELSIDFNTLEMLDLSRSVWNYT